MAQWDEIATFERVVREASFTAAARELGRSKSWVSDQIASLETRLGVRLLNRTTRSVKPTDLGERYYEHAARLVAEAREADAAVTSAALEPSGTLRVTAPTLFGDAFLTPILSAYLAAHPKVRVEVLLTERRVDLVEEGFDVGIRIGALDDSSLGVRRLGAARSIFAASPGYLRRRGTPKNPSELSRHDCVVVSQSASDRWPCSTAKGVRTVAVSGRVAANSITMGLDAAVAGHGVAWLPEFLCAALVQQGRLRRVLRRATPPPYPIAAVFPTHRSPSPRLRAFIDLMVDRTFGTPPWEPSPARVSPTRARRSPRRSG